MTGRFRLEFIRFGLLITVTVALVSIATRAGHHHTSPTAGRHPGPASSTQQTAPVSPAPTTPGRTGSGDGSTTTGSPGSGAGAAAGEDNGATSGSGSAVATLPRTGYGNAVDLAGLAVALIAAGAWTVTVSRPAAR